MDKLSSNTLHKWWWSILYCNAVSTEIDVLATADGIMTVSGVFSSAKGTTVEAS